MLRPIRRVVLGADVDGYSIILSDDAASNAMESPFLPGSGVTAIWTANQAPASNRDEDLPFPITGFPKHGSGGAALMFIHVPPESSLDRLTPEARAAATTPVARTFPEAMEIDISKSHQMHATDTLDYVVVLEGEITVLVDRGEVTLKRFDTLIQRGVNHGWVNRGSAPALVMSTVIDAVPLERKRKPVNRVVHAPAPSPTRRRS